MADCFCWQFVGHLTFSFEKIIFKVVTHGLRAKQTVCISVRRITEIIHNSFRHPLAFRYVGQHLQALVLRARVHDMNNSKSRLPVTVAPSSSLRDGVNSS